VTTGPLSEGELAAGYGVTLEPLGPSPELEAIARQLADVRQLCLTTAAELVRTRELLELALAELGVNPEDGP